MLTSKINLKKAWPDVNYFGPVKDIRGGSCTQVMLVQREAVLDPRSTKSVLAAFARVFYKNVTDLRRVSSILLNGHHELPLLLHRNVILVPLKIRENVCKDEGTTGYIVLDKLKYIENFDMKPYRTRLVFKDGSYTYSVYLPSTVQKRIARAELLNKKYHLYNYLYNNDLTLRETMSIYYKDSDLESYLYASKEINNNLAG